MTKNKREPAEHYFSSAPTSQANYGLVRANLCGRNFEFVTACSVFSIKRIDIWHAVLIESWFFQKLVLFWISVVGYGAVGISAAKINPSLKVCMSDVITRAVSLA
jgi:16S rRNA (guanine1207-N2)-methyltransferase